MNHKNQIEVLNDPSQIEIQRRILNSKQSLKKLYQESYTKYPDVLKRCPKEGYVVELGSGAGFAKEMNPDIITTNVYYYPGIDQVVDATCLPYKDNSIRAFFLLYTFHHISDTESFLREAQRCLRPGGRIFIRDPHVGWIGTWINKYLHHEPFLPEAKDWKFNSSGPVSDANGALAWIIFQRDLARFKEMFPQLRLESYQPHTPLRYWLCGGLKVWNLLPGWAFPMATFFDRLLIKLSPDFGSFVDVELVKTK